MTIHLMKSLQLNMTLTISHSKDFTNKGIVLFLCNIKIAPQQTGQSTNQPSPPGCYLYIPIKKPPALRIAPKEIENTPQGFKASKGVLFYLSPLRA